MDVAVENYKNRHKCMTKIKVLLANSQESLRESLRKLIYCQTDMEVVGEAREPIELLLMVGKTQAEVVIVTLPNTDEDPGIYSHLLAEYPQLLILALSTEHENAYLYRQLTAKEHISKASEEVILAVIRKVKNTYF